jgi:uncharacterized protein
MIVKESINPDFKKKIIHAVEYHFPQAKIILFGSRARKNHKEGADVDIALDADEPIKLGELACMRVTMENLPIPLFVDLVDMHSIPEELRKVILAEGEMWKS